MIEQKEFLASVKVENGKYEFQVLNKGGNVIALRYNEPWITFDPGPFVPKVPREPKNKYNLTPEAALGISK